MQLSRRQLLLGSAASVIASATPLRVFANGTEVDSAQFDTAAKELLAQLTLDEKISMMSGDTPFYEGLAGILKGDYNRLPLTVAGAVPRLNIAGVRFADGPRGTIFPGATTFPAAIARGASFDPELEERIGDVMGREARIYGANMIGAPCINLMRHPAWGRSQETYGEDSYHLGEMGVALVNGIQNHVMSCAKHFALNSMENSRFKVDVSADERAMHEVYFPHFKRVVDAGVASLMSSYNSLNGEWAGQNKDLLTGVLQDQWGFEGFVQSDWVWGMRDAKKAALAGQHVEMPFTNVYQRSLKGLIDAGEVPESVIDDAVLRVLRQQLRFADAPSGESYSTDQLGVESSRRLAREAAAKSIVLLKNENGILPLQDVQQLAVIGPLADTLNLGDHGSSATQPSYAVTPLQGLSAAANAPFNIRSSDGADLKGAAELAQLADVAVVVVGMTYLDEGEYVAPQESGPWMDHFPKPTDADAASIKEADDYKALSASIAGSAHGGDRSSLRLHPDDEKLIETVVAANPRTIVAMMGGSAVITEAWRDQVPGIMMLWYPGQEGGHAFADILLGNVNPSGKLPCTFPRKLEDLPHFDKEATQATYDLWHGYRKLDRDGNQAAFPFGFGLSYTTFALDDLQLVSSKLNKEDVIAISVTLSNTGDRAGQEVVQLYVGARDSKVERANKELKAFTKVALEPGQTRVLQLEVPVQELAYYDSQAGWVVEPGNYEVIVGTHSADKNALRSSFSIS